MVGDQGPGPSLMKAWTCIVLRMPAAGMKTVDQHTQIPAAFAGQVVKIDRDFLGKSIYIHAMRSILTTAVSFCPRLDIPCPRDGLQTGQQVAAGEIIAAGGGISRQKDQPPAPRAPDVCLGAGRISGWISLHWKNLGHDPGIRLIDPLAVISSFV